MLSNPAVGIRGLAIAVVNDILMVCPANAETSPYTSFT